MVMLIFQQRCIQLQMLLKVVKKLETFEIQFYDICMNLIT